MSNVRAWLSGGHVHFLQLATRLTEVTRRHAPSRHRSRQCISCWRAARCSWSCSLIPPCSCATLLGDNMRFSRRDMTAGGTEHAVGTPVFPILQRLVDADFAAVEIGSMLVMFLRARCWLVGAFAVHGNYICDTFCSMAYIFKGHLNNIRKWLYYLYIFENIKREM